MNGAGIIKNYQELEPFLHPNLSNNVILAGSFTLAPREGNSGNVWYVGKDHASNADLNKLGLPNPGFEGMKRLIEAMGGIMINKKILGISISEFSVENIITMIRGCVELGISYIQVNTSCPNVVSDGKQKPIFCYNAELMSELIEEIDGLFVDSNSVPIIDIKVSAYLDHIQHTEIASIIASSKSVSAVSAINTIANGRRYYEDGTPVIGTDHYGGVSGPGIFPIAVGQVAQWRTVLPETISVIGIGGISSGNDVHEMLNAGASMVQIVSTYLRTQNVGVFNEIYADFLQA